MLEVFDSFYRAGSLVFGGGHVVLPLLQELVVAPGWVSNAEFVAGYGAAQAVPGPLFTFSAYLGIFVGMPSGWTGGLFALGAIFLPSFLLVIGVAPFWDRLRSWARFGSALRGINAAVVGLLLAALYDPVWTSAIYGPDDFGLSLVALGLLAIWKWPPWLVVVLSAGVGQGADIRGVTARFGELPDRVTTRVAPTNLAKRRPQEQLFWLPFFLDGPLNSCTISRNLSC